MMRLATNLVPAVGHVWTDADSVNEYKGASVPFFYFQSRGRIRMKKNRKYGRVVVVGAGNVGATVAYTILMNDLTSEIVLVDVNENKARGEVLDMNHGLAYFKQVEIRQGTYEDCAEADIIVITAGAGRKPGQTRLELAKINVAIVTDITKNIMKYAKDPIILVVSNPVDVLTYIVQKVSGLSPRRVIGSGTTLDTARLKYFLSEKCDIDVRSIHAYVVGEHGDSEVVLWSHSNVAGEPFEDFYEGGCEEIDYGEVFGRTKDAGAEIISLKGATTYGIAMATARIIGCILGGENAVMTVSSTLSGQHGLHDVALSLPCLIGSGGIERYLNLAFSEKEEELLQKSAQKIKGSIAEVYQPEM